MKMTKNYGTTQLSCIRLCLIALNTMNLIIIIIIITDLYSAFRSEDTEALDAAQED